MRKSARTQIPPFFDIDPFIGKNSFQCYLRLIRNNEFKNDQLEIVLSVRVFIYLFIYTIFKEVYTFS